MSWLDRPGIFKLYSEKLCTLLTHVRHQDGNYCDHILFWTNWKRFRHWTWPGFLGTHTIPNKCKKLWQLSSDTIISSKLIISFFILKIISKKGNIYGHTYQQDKEHKKDESDEVNGSQDTIGLLNTSKIEISKNNSKLCKSFMGRKENIISPHTYMTTDEGYHCV